MTEPRPHDEDDVRGHQQPGFVDEADEFVQRTRRRVTDDGEDVSGHALGALDPKR